MPKMNGKKCLKALKEHGVFKNITVIIYSTSSSIRDKNATADLGAAYFLTKPNSISGLKKEIELAISR
jgi:DNA-binding response OmpR family regulator